MFIDHVEVSEFDKKWMQSLKNSFIEILSYISEPQGEGICLEIDGSGFYTISEERNDIPAHLYFYQRID